MNRSYLNAVDAEVLAVQRRLVAYARKHPKIAARLRLGNDVTSDPHVGRLIQSFAVLIARTRCRVEDAFPEIIEPLINAAVHPHLQALPSLAIAELSVDPDQPPDITGAMVPRGSELQTDLMDGRICRVRTCADVEFWPVELTEAAIDYPPFPSTSSRVSQASCTIRLSLNSMAGNIPINEVEADSLQFYLHGEKETSLRLYEALFCDATGIQVVCDAQEQMVLGPDVIRSAGFSPNDRLLKSTGQPEGERLLSELVALPERFLFFEIAGLRDVFTKLESTNVELRILLNDVAEDFPGRIESDSIRLGCVPVVNLFEVDTEPAEVNAVQPDADLIVNSREPDNGRIHGINRVIFRAEDETEREIPPLHRQGHTTPRSPNSIYWIRLPDRSAAIRFVNLSGRPAEMESGTVTANVVCSNGNIPGRQLTEDQWPALQPQTPGVVVESRFLTRPTTWQPDASINFALQLIDRSLPQPASTAATEESSNVAAALREHLQLTFRDSDSVFAQMAEFITDIRIRRVTGIHLRRMVCHGLEIQVSLDDVRTVTGGVYLFAEILRRLFARYATQSTFVRFRMTTTSGRDYGLWPTIEGERFNV